MTKRNYAPVELGCSSIDSYEDDNTIEMASGRGVPRDALSAVETVPDDELHAGIDNGVVGELTQDLRELRKGLVVMILLFVVLGVVIALDDYYTKRYIDIDDELQLDVTWPDDDAVAAIHRPPFPSKGHKFQINASALTVNDFECVQLDSGKWPSERVHCELASLYDGEPTYDFVVEHFDDEQCQKPNPGNPVIRHTSSGCVYYEAYNHSYNDLCHTNRTFTISAFYGQGCLDPMPVTAVNLPPESR